MLVQSAIVAAGSGSLGGMVWSHNAGGQYLRKRVVPTNPNSSRQVTVRMAMAQLTEAWSQTLIGSQRAAWNDYAEAVELMNPLGAARTVSGLNMYIRTNVPRAAVNLTRIDTAPTNLTLASLSPVSLAFTVGEDQDFVFTNTDDWATAEGGALMVQVSSPVEQSINFFKGPYFSTGLIAGDDTTPPTSPTSASWISGTGPVSFPLLKKVFFRATALNADGRVSLAQYGSGLITA